MKFTGSVTIERIADAIAEAIIANRRDVLCHEAHDGTDVQVRFDEDALKYVVFNALENV